jgi:hypothetical protein
MVNVSAGTGLRPSARSPAENHQGDQSPNRPLTIGVGADKLLDVADGAAYAAKEA